MSSVYCPECKAENSSLAEYCKKCGADFKTIKPSVVPFTGNEPEEKKSIISRIRGLFYIVLIAGCLIATGLFLRKAGVIGPTTPTITHTPWPTYTSGPTWTPRPGNLTSTWPPGYGYLITPRHKPSEPHSVYTFGTEWEIWSESFGNYEAHGEIEYFQSKNMAFAPGAKITNHTRAMIPLDVGDYNGDICRIPYGMSVEVDRYGQFEPYWYYPDMPPPK